MEYVYKVSDLKRIIAESSNEFKAKMGDGVESDDKENAGKAYKEATKRAKDFDGGLKEPEKKKPTEKDCNKTTLDYRFDNEIDDKTKKRIQAQAEGYTSVAEKENGIEKSGDFEGNKQIYQDIKKSGQEMHKDLEDVKKTGLQAREMPADTFKTNEIYENKVLTAYFKKTEFLSEANMMSKIPDEFKVEGRKFKMKDKNGSEYLLEWKYKKANILEHSNKHGFNESVERMKQLFDYKSQDTETTRNVRLDEGENRLNKSLDIMRKINKM